MRIFFLIIFIFISSNNFLFGEQSKIEIEIYKNLRCLICQGQSIADSNSDFAQTVKLVVADQLKQGKSQDEIYEFLVSKYGEWIVYKPMINKSNFFLWFLPYLTLLIGGAIIFLVIKKSKYNKVN
tara:strand:- start:410 stop:784 length:375 start_codon:yes stop_codon:yes gene_type:complete